jgi:rSAM/selenodomain-associated transferase 1
VRELNEPSDEGEGANRGNALLIFVKYPFPGTVKTRLSPELTPEQGAAFYKALAREVVQVHIGAAGYESIVCFCPESARREVRSWLGPDVRLWSQLGADLGARQFHAMKQALEAGYGKAAIIGSDCPTIAPGDIEAAFAWLDETDLVLGPCEDGGYYLIGATRPIESLFEGIGWGSECVLSETLEKAQKADLTPALLDVKFDIDSYEDLERYYRSRRDGAGDRPEMQSWRILDAIMRGRG